MAIASPPPLVEESSLQGRPQNTEESLAVQLGHGHSGLVDGTYGTHVLLPNK